MANPRESWSYADAFARWTAVGREAWWTGASGPSNVARVQRERLDALLRYAAAHSPFYAAHFGPLPRRMMRVSDVPPLDRAQLMARFDDAVTDRAVRREAVEAFVADRARIGHPFLGRYAVWTSSGTSGTPGLYVQDAGAIAVYDALAAVRFGGHFLSGARVALVAATEGHFAGVATWERLRLTYPTIRDKARVFPITAPVAELVRDLERFGPDCIASYPTTLRALAEEKLAGRTTLKPSGMWSGGETCSAAVRDAVTRAFGCPVANDYGASEFMNMAHPCARGALHVNSDWVLLEPVDEKRRPVPAGTVSASVLLTNLANRVQPLIRYDLGDSVVMGASRCACGSPFPTLRVEGRNDEILRLAAGRRRVALLPMGISTAIEEEARVHRFQVVQTAASTLEVRLEPASGAFGREERERVKRVVGGYLARHGLPDATLAVKRGPFAAAAPGGKFRHIWREDQA